MLGLTLVCLTLFWILIADCVLYLLIVVECGYSFCVFFVEKLFDIYMCL